MSKLVFQIIFLFIILPVSNNAFSFSPKLNFTDIISGPKTGLGDDQGGSGVIITVWGQHLGSAQNNSTLTFTDNLGVSHSPAHIYYWKNADGVLPGGPANLFKSHKMQEIAFSIPATVSDGLGVIKVLTSSGRISNELPFTVRSGNIYHVKANGNDITGNGSFLNPWLTVAKGDGLATGGDTLYIHNVTTASIAISGTDSYAYYNNRGFLSTTVNQFAYIAYPNTRPELYGKVGLGMFLTTGIVSSKLSVFASNCADETLVGCTEKGTAGIIPSDWGRVIGNAITDQPGGCSSGQAGAISGGINWTEGAKIFGNYIFDYGCPNSSRFHHTTYFTIRDRSDKDIEAWEIGWNFLDNNFSSNGIHTFDEDHGGNNACGDLTTDYLIHDNVIVDQGGAGIHYESRCGWSQDTYIYNNVVIRSGKPVDVGCTSSCGSSGSGIVVKDEGILGSVNVYNNTIINWDPLNQDTSLQSCIVLRGPSDNAFLTLTDNVCINSQDKPFLTAFSFFSSVDHTDNIGGEGNIWFYSGSVTAVKANIPHWFALKATISDPQLNLQGNIISLNRMSLLIKNNNKNVMSHDIYGNPRNNAPDIGAVEYSVRPNSPSTLQIILDNP